MKKIRVGQDMNKKKMNKMTNEKKNEKDDLTMIYQDNQGKRYTSWEVRQLSDWRFQELEIELIEFN